jgi:hypothetical protein
VELSFCEEHLDVARAPLAKVLVILAHASVFADVVVTYHPLQRATYLILNEFPASSETPLTVGDIVRIAGDNYAKYFQQEFDAYVSDTKTEDIQFKNFGAVSKLSDLPRGSLPLPADGLSAHKAKTR